MAIDYKAAGARIKGFRKSCNLSQEELGAKVDVSYEHINRIEGGSRAISLDLLIRIANELKVSADDILVESLENSASTADDDIHRLLLDCTETEKKILTKTLTFMKALLTEFGI